MKGHVIITLMSLLRLVVGMSIHSSLLKVLVVVKHSCQINIIFKSQMVYEQESSLEHKNHTRYFKSGNLMQEGTTQVLQE